MFSGKFVKANAYSWWCKQCSTGQDPGVMQAQKLAVMLVQTPDVTDLPAIIVAPRKKGKFRIWILINKL